MLQDLCIDACLALFIDDRFQFGSLENDHEA